MKRPLVSLLAGCLFAGTLIAVAPQDLGEGLGYVRVETLAAEPLPRLTTPYVLDLRYPEMVKEGPGLASLTAQLRVAPPGTMVLLSPETPAAVIKSMQQRSAGVLVLGLEGMNSDILDFTIDATPEEDRAAYNAFEEGVELIQLVRPSLEKERFDEAMLVKAHNGRIRNRRAADAPPPAIETAPVEQETLTAAESEEVAEVEGDEAEEGETPATVTPFDAMLRRAMQLHRGLKALGRI